MEERQICYACHVHSRNGRERRVRNHTAVTASDPQGVPH